jgi:soluble lytic murein transglycosylase-like protein
MVKPAIKKKTPSVKTGTKSKAKAAKKQVAAWLSMVQARRFLWLGLEVAALAGLAWLAVVASLGRAAERFAGVGFWSNLAPFAGVVLALALLLFLSLRVWLKIRLALAGKANFLPALAGLVVALGAGWLASGGEFQRDIAALRSLVGGVREAERATLSHQVYAAYRRADLAQMALLVERAKPYEAAIQEAAKLYGVDEAVMMGLGAAESSFLPRDSKDGGRGLFQITAPPKSVLDEVGKQLGGKPLDWRNPRHNAMLAAATWRHYRKEMKDDLFLSLLAYNIGPKNGGLLSIMRQYGAKDFATIQPYLQDLPRDYPIRVLTAALAFRLWKVEGKLPRYEEGNNAKRIQSIGIPGLSEFG